MSKRKRDSTMDRNPFLQWLLLLTVGVSSSLAVTPSSSSSSVVSAFYRRIVNNSRCGNSFRTVPVFSLAACAAICSRESGCDGFSLEGATGATSTRACEMTATASNCVANPSFNFYWKTTAPLPTTTTTPQPTTTTAPGPTTTVPEPTTAPQPTTTTTAPAVETIGCDLVISSGTVPKQAVVGLIPDSNRRLLYQLVMRDLDFSSSEVIFDTGDECGINRVVTSSPCDPTSYGCSQTEAGRSDSDCVQVDITSSNKDAFCPSNMAVVLIVKAGKTVDHIKCCLVNGW